MPKSRVKSEIYRLALKGLNKSNKLFSKILFIKNSKILAITNL